MRFSIAYAGLLASVLALSSCATDPMDEADGASDTATTDNAINDFNDKDFNASNSGGESNEGSSEVANVAQDTAKIEDELKLDEEKDLAPPEDLTIDEAPIAKDELPPPPTVEVEPPPPPPVMAEEPPPVAPAEPSAQVRITDLQFRAAEGGGTIVIKTSAPARYQTRKNEGENQFVIEIENAILPKQFKRPYITKDFNTWVASINAYQDPGSTTARIVVQMRQSQELAVQQDGESLIVVAGNSQPAQAVAENSNGDIESSGFSSFDEMINGSSNFVGKKINIEANDEDIRNVFNLIAEESGANIVVDDKVTGNITVKLRQVPWDQAMVVVMKTKGLGYVRQGNVLRISSMDTLKKETENARDIIESQQKIDPVKVRVVPINYSNIDDLVKQLTNLLTPRGKVVFDNRTSSIVLTDTVESLERLTKLIKTLDVPPDQVLIEGKIVEAQETFSRTLGIKWGASGQPVAMGSSPSGLPVFLQPRAGFAPNMAANQMGLGLSFNIGTLDVLGNLSATLALYEQEQVIKVISSPRVVTMNREKSYITQSDEIPVVQTTQSAGGPAITTTSYVQAELRLDVVPQIAPDGGILMDLDVKREYFGSSSNTASAPPKYARQAKTRVMVRTGQTAVIGGIYDNSQSELEEGIPYLRNIPVLGWLFKNRSRTNKKNELIIFLTPRLLSKTEAQGVSQ